MVTMQEMLMIIIMRITIMMMSRAVTRQIILQLLMYVPLDLDAYPNQGCASMILTGRRAI
jgi:hypothetical protein